MTDATLLRAARSGTIVGAAQLAQYVLTFLLGVAVAAFFGVAGTTDAYFMASSTAEMLTKILLGSALASVFLPVLVSLLAKGDVARARTLFSGLLTLAFLAFVLLGTVMEVFADPIIRFLAPGFPPETHRLTVTLLRFVIPAYLFGFLTELATVPFHAARRFALPAVSRLVVPALTLLALLALTGRVGINAVVIGTLIGTAVQFVTLLAVLRPAGYPYQPTVPWRHAELRRVVVLTLPFVLSIIAADGAGAVYRILVSHEPTGALASLKFSEKIYQISNLLFLGTITQIAFPAFAAAAGSAEDLRARFRTALRAVAFFTIPLSVGIIVLREPLVRALYQRGAFTAAATTATAALLPFFIIGLFGNGVSSLLGHLTLALQKTRSAVGVNVALQAIAAALFVLLVPRFGPPALAFVSGIGPFILSALYLFRLRPHFPGLASAFADRHLLAILVAGAATAVLTSLGLRASALLPPGFGRDLASLAAGALLGGGGFLAVSWLFRVPEVRTVGALLRSIPNILFHRGSAAR